MKVNGDAMKLFIAGEASASAQKDNNGWGSYLHEFISPNLEVLNFAEKNQSTKSFIGSGMLFKIDLEMDSNDYLLIQFGINEMINDAYHFTNYNTDFIENLERFSTVALSHHATPIFLTPIIKYKFNDNKLVEDNLKNYVSSIRDFCEKNNFPLIDIYKISHDIMLKFGKDEAKKFYKLNSNGIHDETLLSSYGAKMFSSIIATELRKYI